MQERTLDLWLSVEDYRSWCSRRQLSRVLDTGHNAEKEHQAIHKIGPRRSALPQAIWCGSGIQIQFLNVQWFNKSLHIFQNQIQCSCQFTMKMERPLALQISESSHRAPQPPTFWQVLTIRQLLTGLEQSWNASQEGLVGGWGFTLDFHVTTTRASCWLKISKRAAKAGALIANHVKAEEALFDENGRLLVFAAHDLLTDPSLWNQRARLVCYAGQAIRYHLSNKEPNSHNPPN